MRSLSMGESYAPAVELQLSCISTGRYAISRVKKMYTHPPFLTDTDAFQPGSIAYLSNMTSPPVQGQCPSASMLRLKQLI
jgi:hypothetical protein